MLVIDARLGSEIFEDYNEDALLVPKYQNSLR